MKKILGFLIFALFFLIFPTLTEAASHLVQVDGLRLRAGPGTTYEIISSLYAGQEVDVQAKEENWAQITVSGLEGWVCADYLTCLKTVAVDAEFLRLRSGPSLEAEIIDQAPYGTALSVLDEEEGWIKVLYRDQVGWMKSDYLVDPSQIDHTLSRESEPTSVKVVTVAALNVRSGPGTDYDRLGLISGGSLITVLQEEGGWSQIEYGENMGWVYSEYLANTELESVLKGLGIEQALSASEPQSTGEVNSAGSSLVVQIAEKCLGIPYVWGGESPEEGFDCSGFVKYVFGQLGFELPHGAEAISAYGEPVAFEDLHPGDVVFFQNTYRYGVSHLGIWVGNNTFIHPPEPGFGVCYEELSGFYLSHYWGARRLIP